jgi:hypothetical protein
MPLEFSSGLAEVDVANELQLATPCVFPCPRSRDQLRGQVDAPDNHSQSPGASSEMVAE